MIELQLQQRLQMQQMSNPAYQQQQMYNMDSSMMNHIPPPMGNATPFVPMAGNATPFNPLAGNATPFNPLAGNATPWNPQSQYAATPFHSFSLDNAVGSTSISNDPRFAMMQPTGDPMAFMPQDDMNMSMPMNTVVDKGFSRRANANNRVGTGSAGGTSSRGRAGTYASRGKSGRSAPVYAGSRRGSRSTNGESRAPPPPRTAQQTTKHTY